MEITIEYLREKLKEYQAAYDQHIALANANHGAIEAIQNMIAETQAKQDDNRSK